jgi:proline iminopeptidase
MNSGYFDYDDRFFRKDLLQEAVKKLIMAVVILVLVFFSGCSSSHKHEGHGKISSGTDTGYVEVAGTKLNYRAEGEGLPCLVIGSSVYYPRTFSGNIRKHLRLYFVDMRWFAREYSPVPPGNFILDTILSDIEKVRESLGLDRMIILGHSIHSVIALEYAKRYPGRVSHVVMIGAPAWQSNRMQDEAVTGIWETASPERKKLQNENWQRLAGMQGLTPAEFEIENYCLMSPKYWYDMNYDARWLWKDMTLNTPILFALYDQVFRDYYVFREGRKVPVPVFVAMGRFDYVDPYTLWEGYEDVKGLTVKIFEKSGHTPQLEQSDLFDCELLDWIKDYR